MKRKPGVEIFERLLQTIVAPLVVAGGCLAFVLIKIPLMVLTLFLLDRDRSRSLNYCFLASNLRLKCITRK